ncbi:unnamed protein product, partial [Cyprideis torosa]
VLSDELPESNCFKTFEAIDNAPEEKTRGITIHLCTVGYSTTCRHYAHTDCPGHADYIKNMIIGTSRMDAAILVVAATDGVMPQTKQHIALTKQIGVEQLIVFINKADVVDQDMLELAELEVRELLELFGYRNTPVVAGSALLALSGDQGEYGVKAIHRLLKALDEVIVQPERDDQSPFMLMVDHTYSIRGRGTVGTGVVYRGVVKKHTEIEVLGFGQRLKSNIADLEIFKKPVPFAKAGDSVGVLLRGIQYRKLRRGMTICPKKTVPMTNHFHVTLYCLTAKEGGLGEPILSTHFGHAFIHVFSSAVRLDHDQEFIMPGETVDVSVTVSKPIAILTGTRLVYRSLNGHIIGYGLVKKALKPVVLVDGRLKKAIVPPLKQEEEVAMEETQS